MSRKTTKPFSELIAQCPFYKFERDLKLHCEGGQVYFKDKEHRKAFLKRNCGSLTGWKTCVLAVHLCRQYEKTL